METNKSQITPTIKATNDQINTMLEYYQGYITYNTNAYIIARVKLAKVTITFYKTGNVLFQGTDYASEYNFWASKFGIEQLQIDALSDKERFYNLTAIGSDEVGTGDYFGPVVVCAAYVTKENISKLSHLGVKDSKLLTDTQMVPLALKIAEIVPYVILTLSPERFNSLKSSSNNLNYVKAIMHNNAINSILKKYPNYKYDAILIDEFAPRDKYFEYLKNAKQVNENVTLVKHGENAHIAVAAASILARVAFLKELKHLSKEYDLELMKGAGKEADRVGVAFVKSYGLNELAKVAKIKFANTERIKQYFVDHHLIMKIERDVVNE